MKSFFRTIGSDMLHAIYIGIIISIILHAYFSVSANTVEPLGPNNATPVYSAIFKKMLSNPNLLDPANDGKVKHSASANEVPYSKIAFPSPRTRVNSCVCE